MTLPNSYASRGNAGSGEAGLRVAVIGGGVVGLACALELRRRGAEVRVYERAPTLGAGVSSRAAGMLGPTFEAALEGDAPGLFDLARQAGEVWGEFAARIEQLGGGPVEYARKGTIACGASALDIALVERLAAICEQRGLPVRRLTAAQVREMEPAVTARIEAALFLPEDGQVDPLALTARMAAALERSGGGISTGVAVKTVTCGRVLSTPDGREWDRIVVATGASRDGVMFRSAEGDAMDPGFGAIVPVKGQMLALQAGVGAPERVVRFGAGYVVPRARWTLVGATSEPGRDDEATDRDALDDLRARATAVMGGLALARETASWAGVRPGTADGLPIIGEGAIPGVFAALGLYRNGVLLAPAAAGLVAGAAMGGKARPWAGSFSPLRFHPGFDKTAAAPHSRD